MRALSSPSDCRSCLRLAFAILLTVPILLAAGVESADAQEFRRVTGQVTGSAGESLAGVNITVEGTTLGTVSGDDGQFAIEVPDREVRLQFRLIGFRTQTVSVPADRDRVEVSLVTDVLGMDEIVVSGRATQIARRNVTTQITKLQSDELVQSQPQTVESAMYGKVSGANIQTNSGAPGGGMQINLRGVTTVIGEFKPLYIVDGVIVNNSTTSSGVFTITGSSDDPQRGGTQDNSPNRIADLAPSEIESIEILKGAAASAQYGSKASNGVIIITTKKGQSGETTYRLNQRYGVSDVSELLGLRRFETREDAAAAFGEDVAEEWAPGRFFDHERAIAGRNPFNFDINGSASGAAGDTRFFASGLVRDEQGVIPGTFHQKESVRLNLNQRVSDRFDIDVSTNGIHTVSDRSVTNNDNRNVSLWLTLPFTPSFVDLDRNADGTFPDNPGTRSNPIETASEVDNEEEVWRFLGSTNLDFTAFQTEDQSLRLRGLAGVDITNQQNTLISPPNLQFEGDDGLLGTSVRGDVEALNFNLEANVIHELNLGLGTRATTSAGIQFEVRDSDFTRITAQNLIAGQTNIDRGTVTNVRQVQERAEDLGFFLQEEVIFKDNLSLVAGFRADQSSNNVDIDELFFYPRGAIAYTFDDLIPGFVDELKLRTAYGESGNRPLFGQKFTQLGGATLAGLGTVGVQGVTAAELEPERQRELEGGIDATLFGERFTLSATGYNKWVVDVLLQRELAPSTGFETAIFNGGKLRARGFEAEFGGNPVRGGKFGWSFNTTFTVDDTKMLDLPVEPFQVEGFGFLFGTFQLAEGESLTAMWGNVTREDGTTTTDVIGNSTPDFRVGFSNSLQFGSLSFDMVWDWQQGSDIFNLTQLLFDLGANSPDCNDPATDGLPGESVCAKRLRLWPNQTDVYLESATFLKAREMALSWDLPEGFRQRFLPIAESARLSFEGRNLLTFTPYSGLDPEVSNFGGTAIGRNVDVAPFPPSRNFWFGLDLSF